MSFNLHFQTECDSLSVFCSAFRGGKAEIQTRPNSARKVRELIIYMGQNNSGYGAQSCISCGSCSYPELTEDHVLPSA